MSEHTNPSTSTDRIRPGDVLFFAPKTETKDYAKFDQLAAYVQGAPYGGGKPWHHVAVAGASWPVIGFGQTGDPQGDGRNWEPNICGHAWEETRDFAVIALRPPHGGEVVAEQAESLIGQEYAIAGLLAFAAATQGRMFVEGDTRKQVLDFAAGAEAEARKTTVGHTCVTAAVAPLVAAGYSFQVAEPSPPPVPPDEVLEGMCEPVERVYARLKRGAGREDDYVELGTGLLDQGQVAAGWGISGDVPIGRAPGLIETTTDYLNLLARVIEEHFTATPEQLVRLGKDSRRRGELTVSWRVSPAMLHDALLAAGFTVVR